METRTEREIVSAFSYEVKAILKSSFFDSQETIEARALLLRMAGYTQGETSGSVSLWTCQRTDSNDKEAPPRFILAAVECLGTYSTKYSYGKVGIITRVTDEEAKIVMRHFRLKLALSERGIGDIDLYSDKVEFATNNWLSLDAMQWVIENREEITADWRVMTQVYEETTEDNKLILT